MPRLPFVSKWNWGRKRQQDGSNLPLQDTPPAHNPNDKTGPKIPQNDAGTASQASPMVRGPSDRTQVAKAGVMLALDLAEKALDGLPIPGAKGTVGGVLKVLKSIEKSTANTDTLRELEKQINSLREDVLMPIIGRNDSELKELGHDAEVLSSHLQDLIEAWTTRADHGHLRKVVSADDDELGLAELSKGMNRAITKFQLSAQIRAERNLAGLQQTLLINLPRARYAAHDADRAGGPSACFEGTREAILGEIVQWIKSVETDTARVFWLNGLAGIGKSTIAKTIADYAQKHGLLGGSFFFSRDDNSLREITHVFPSLAYQFAQYDAKFKSAIVQLLQEDSSHGEKPLAIQFNKLMVTPMQMMNTPDRVVLFVLDALDECNSEGKIAEFLRLILRSACNIPVHLRILLTSRPEHHIRSVFADAEHDKDFHKQFRLHDIEESVVKEDIQRYLEVRLSDIPRELRVPVPDDWPSRDDLKALVDRSGKLFVYAATSLRFIGNDRARNPPRRLQIILGVHDSPNTRPYAQLDALYLQVLDSALPQDSDPEDFVRFQVVVGSIVLLRHPLPLNALSAFTGYVVEDVRNALYHLHSLVLVPESEMDSPRIYHPSFPDFLTDNKRCSDESYAIVISTHERRIVRRCFEMLKVVLKRDMLCLGNTLSVSSEIPDLNDRLAAVFPPEIEYCLLQWPSHMIKAPLASNDQILSELYAFVTGYILYWFEAMSLLRKISLATSYMRDLHAWAKDNTYSTDLVDFLYDCYRFGLSHQDVISINALHVYQTALPLTPKGTSIFQSFRHEMHNTLRVVHGVAPQWSPLLNTTHCRGWATLAVAFSPDGSKFATATDRSHSVILWDAISSSHLMTLTHTGIPSSVVFIPSSALLAAAGPTTSIRVWDTVTGSQVREMHDHANITCLASSGSILVSASSDGTVMLLDTSTWSRKEMIQNTGLDAITTNCLALSPDGNRLICGSSDGLVRIWDAKSMHPRLTKTLGDNGTVVRSIAISHAEGMIASGLDDGKIHLFNDDDDSPRTLIGGTNPVTSLAFSPVNTTLVSVGTEEPMARLWDTTSGDMLWAFRGNASCVAFSPNGIFMVLAYSDGTCRMWDTSVISDADPDDHTNFITAVALSEDGIHVATGGDHNECVVRLWDAVTGTLRHILRGHDWAIYSLAFSLNSSLLASGSGDCTIKIWEVDSGNLLTTLYGPDDYVKGVTISDDSQITARTNNWTYYWDLTQPEDPLPPVEEENPMIVMQCMARVTAEWLTWGMVDFYFSLVNKIQFVLRRFLKNIESEGSHLKQRLLSTHVLMGSS